MSDTVRLPTKCFGRGRDMLPAAVRLPEEWADMMPGVWI